MIQIKREELKRDWQNLISYIQKHHVMGPEIEKELFIDREPVVGLCHTRGYFILFGEFYVQYVMDHIITEVATQQIGRRIEEVYFYDSYSEYESERVKAMSAVSPSEQTGINLN